MPYLMTRETHVIIAPDPDGNAPLIMPLKIQRVTSYLLVHKPSQRECDSMSIPGIELTSEHLDWDPASNRYEEQEEATTDFRGEIAHHVQTGTNLVISACPHFLCHTPTLLVMITSLLCSRVKFRYVQLHLRIDLAR